jgi:hypothetical protein
MIMQVINVKRDRCNIYEFRVEMDVSHLPGNASKTMKNIFWMQVMCQDSN